MSREQDHSHPTDVFGLPEGLLAALIGALLLIGSFALHSFATPMPPAERWAGMTSFTLLALGVTLPGCAALYDGLGRVVRRDRRAMVALLALIPALYGAYAFAVRELTATGLLAALLFTAVPALTFGPGGTHREPTMLDGVGLTYLGLSLWLQLLPPLTLPQQGGLVGFFQLAVVPLLLLLFAARGWPGLGYTWHLSGRELRDALVAGGLATALALLVAPLLGGTLLFSGRLPGAGDVVLATLRSYFFVALPMELLLRGGVQNGLTRALAARAGTRAPWIALGVTSLIAVLAGLTPGWAAPGPLATGSAGLAAGWVYLRTGKVSAAAVSSALIVLGLSLLAWG